MRLNHAGGNGYALRFPVKPTRARRNRHDTERQSCGIDRTCFLVPFVSIPPYRGDPACAHRLSVNQMRIHSRCVLSEPLTHLFVSRVHKPIDRGG